MIAPAEICDRAVDAGFTDREAMFLLALVLMIFVELRPPDVCPVCRKPPVREGD